MRKKRGGEELRLKLFGREEERKVSPTINQRGEFGSASNGDLLLSDSQYIVRLEPFIVGYLP